MNRLVYKILFLSSLWLAINSIFRASRITKIWIDVESSRELFDSPQEALATKSKITTTTITTTIEQRVPNNRNSNGDGESIAINTTTTNTTTKKQQQQQQRPRLFRNCTSPEASIPWPFHPEHEAPEQLASQSQHASSVLNPHLKCGLGLNSSNNTTNSFTEYFENTIKAQLIQPILEKEGCHDLVVFGGAFGEIYVQYMKDELLQENRDGDGKTTVNPTDLVEKHGQCFFMFVNHPNPTEGKLVMPWKLGHYWLVPVEQKKMPYKNARRNTKLLKYMGQYAFLNNNNSNNGDEDDSRNDNKTTKPVSTSVIIWQDAKFFRSGFITSIPRDYNTVLREDSSDSNSNLPCMTTMGLPSKASTFGRPLKHNLSLGLGVSSYRRPSYKDHCQTIIDALKGRPGVTDSPTALVEQCEAYMEFAFDEEEIEELRKPYKNKILNRDDEIKEETDDLNFGLIDSAFLVWNESTQQCRDFNAVLRCTMLDQLQCHSDRDQVLFPMVIHQMLAASNSNSSSSSGVNANANANMNTDIIASDDTDIIGCDDSDFLYALKATYYNSFTETKSIIDTNWKPHAHDLDLVDSSKQDVGQEQVYVRIKRSGCHWYYFDWARNQPMGERLCGHKIWMKDSLEHQNPALEQEIQIAGWSKNKNRNRNTMGELVSNANADLSLAAARGMLDRIDAPFAADFHKCTSPEYGRFPWMFREDGEDNAESESGPPTCGTMRSGKLSPFHQKLQQTVLDPKIRHLANEEMCSDMVVFGETLSETNLTRLLSILDGEDGVYKEKRSKQQSNHGNCFFLFVVEQDLPSKWKAANSNSTLATHAVSAAGHYWLIPVDKELLPYESTKRNSKLFQYNGQFFFPNAKAVVYQDTRFFSRLFLDRQPNNYSKLFPRLNGEDQDLELEPCLTVFALPKTRFSVGKENIRLNEEFFQGQCKHVIKKLEKKKNTTDGAITT